jgi:type II secretory pathway pseudopilin PulG
MRLTLMVISILLALASLSCRQKNPDQKEQQVQQQQENVDMQQSDSVAGQHTAVVQEVLQATSYTYLKVKEADSDYWIAVTKRQIEPGTEISFSGALEMRNFQSKDLQRTFETVYFVSKIDDGGGLPESHPSMSMPHQGTPEPEKKEVSIESAQGGVTIGELFANRDSYADKTVRVKGQVTKVNRAIMDKNWVHLQDGTSDSNSFDLTITTTDNVEVGDIATFEGKITLKKDFGAGYYYEVIMEEAKLQDQ